MPQAAPVMHAILQLSWWTGLLESIHCNQRNCTSAEEETETDYIGSNFQDDSDNTKEGTESDYIDNNLPDDSNDGLEENNQARVFP